MKWHRERKPWLEQIEHVCALNKIMVRAEIEAKAVRVPLLRTTSPSCLEGWREELEFLDAFVCLCGNRTPL